MATLEPKSLVSCLQVTVPSPGQTVVAASILLFGLREVYGEFFNHVSQTFLSNI